MCSFVRVCENIRRRLPRSSYHGNTWVEERLGVKEGETEEWMFVFFYFYFLIVCLVMLVHYLLSYQQNAVIPLCSHTHTQTCYHTHIQVAYSSLNDMCA